MNKSILLACTVGLCATLLPTEALAHRRQHHHSHHRHHSRHRVVHRDPPATRFYINFGAPPVGYERCVYKPWRNKTVCTNYWP